MKIWRYLRKVSTTKERIDAGAAAAPGFRVTARNGGCAMDSDTVQKIAIEVAKHLPTLAWAALVIQVVLTVAAAAAGAIFGEYFGTRGKNLATKADFESLKDQLRANTELVETIKSEVSQRDWAKREWANLRRLKLEQLLEQVDDRDHYRDLIRTNALGGNSIEARDPISAVDMLTILYFLELASQVQEYFKLHLAYVASAHKLLLDTLTAGTDLVERQKVADLFLSTLHQRATKLALATDAIQRAARKVLLEITGLSVTASDAKA